VPTTHINGIDVYYERDGQGPPLLFINGSGATLSSSGVMIDVFRHRFDVLAYDQRGLGRTSIPDGPYSMADYAADAAALAEVVGWDRYSVIGVSFGGMVAQELAVTVPERIHRLALLCTSPGGRDHSSYPLHTLADKSPEERAALGMWLLDTRFTNEWLATHAGDRALAEMIAERTGIEKSAEVARGERLQLEARGGHDVNDRLGRITSPTIVGAGRYDGIAPLANSQAIVSKIAGAELRVYDGGHIFMIQDPTAFPEIIEFLAG